MRRHRQVIALLLVPTLASAEDWQWSAGVASEQVERGQTYIDRPYADASVYRYAGSGWFGGAGLARSLGDEQASLSASGGYAWQAADTVDLQLELAHRDYRMAHDWRFRYQDASLTANFQDRVFVSVHRLFGVRSRTRYTALDVPSSLTADVVWRQPLPAGTALMAGLGHARQDGPGGVSYHYGSLTLRVPVERATFEAAWIATDGAAQRAYGGRAGKRWVASLRWHFF